MSKPTRILALAVVVFVAASIREPRRAAACDADGFEIVTTFLLIGTVAVAIPMSLHDVVVRHSSRGYAIAETVVMGASTLANGKFLVDSFQTCGSVTGESEEPIADSSQRTRLTFAMLWSAALAAHGIYELVTERDTPVTPTVVTDGDHVGAGVAWIGRF
jgi:hypothetical protein